MFRLFLLCALAALSAAQYQKSPQNAAILSDARYLTGDGQFGAAYSQEDGVEFKEESDGEGNRRGTYSYVDPNGQRRTITYTAGKNGFVASGDHLPQAPPAPAPVAPQPQYNPLPQYNPPKNSWDNQDQWNNQDGQWNNDDGQWNNPTPQPAPQQWNQPQRSWNNPPPQQYNPPPQQFSQPQPQYNPPQQQWTTTPAPHRFFPPGKLSLNRSPDGFSYTFSKN